MQQPPMLLDALLSQRYHQTPLFTSCQHTQCHPPPTKIIKKKKKGSKFILNFPSSAYLSKRLFEMNNGTHREKELTLL